MTKISSVVAAYLQALMPAAINDRAVTESGTFRQKTFYSSEHLNKHLTLTMPAESGNSQGSRVNPSAMCKYFYGFLHRLGIF